MFTFTRIAVQFKCNWTHIAFYRKSLYQYHAHLLLPITALTLIYYADMLCENPLTHSLRCGCNPCLYLDATCRERLKEMKPFCFISVIQQSWNRCTCQCLTKSLCFSAVPSAPYGITLLSSDGASMTLAWKRPKHTGGSKITSYYLDKREANSVMWKEVSSRPASGRVYKVSRSFISYKSYFYSFAI